MDFRTAFKNKAVINIIKTVSFYILSFVTISIVDKQSPGGPCVPGGGIFAFFLLIFVSIVLFLINLYKAIEINRSYWVSVLIHTIVWACIFLIFKISL
jgi:hypothetical protein